MKNYEDWDIDELLAERDKFKAIANELFDMLDEARDAMLGTADKELVDIAIRAGLLQERVECEVKDK